MCVPGDSVWQKVFNSPVVGVYSSDGLGDLRKVQITPVGLETLKAITGSSPLTDTTCTVNPSNDLFKYALYYHVAVKFKKKIN